MQERISVTVSQPRVSTSAGASPVSVTVTLTNRSQIVDQFDIATEGVPADWCDIAPERVSLFPGESARVTLNLHPPRREDVIAGSYTVAIRATSRDSAASVATGSVGLTITPSGGFQLQMLKARDTGRLGSFSARATSLSDAPMSLNLRAFDPETALTFFFPATSVQLGPYEHSDIAFQVKAKKEPLKGEPVAYPFTIEAEPQLPNPAQAAQATQRAQGEFVFRPRLRRWPWAGLPRLVSIAVPGAAAVAALMAVLVASGAIGPDDPPPPDIQATLQAHDRFASATASALAAMTTQTGTPTLTPTATGSATPMITATATRTPAAPTRTPTRTQIPTRTPTRTPGPIVLPPLVFTPLVPPFVLPTFAIGP